MLDVLGRLLGAAEKTYDRTDGRLAVPPVLLWEAARTCHAHLTPPPAARAAPPPPVPRPHQEGLRPQPGARQPARRPRVRRRGQFAPGGLAPRRRAVRRLGHRLPELQRLARLLRPVPPRAPARQPYAGAARLLRRAHVRAHRQARRLPYGVVAGIQGVSARLLRALSCVCRDSDFERGRASDCDCAPGSRPVHEQCEGRRSHVRLHITVARFFVGQCSDAVRVHSSYATS